jgi:hypothetical protein
MAEDLAQSRQQLMDSRESKDASKSGSANDLRRVTQQTSKDSSDDHLVSNLIKRLFFRHLGCVYMGEVRLKTARDTDSDCPCMETLLKGKAQYS